MKLKLLDYLICPDCGGNLKCEKFKGDKGNEITQGLLSCIQCGQWFPIINGIPRILPRHLRQLFLLRHKEFFSKYPSLTSITEETKLSLGDRVKIKTAASFGFEWTTFSEMYKEWEDNFLYYTEPIEPEFYKGRIVLDAGCGIGRHIYYAAKFSAEAIGIDLSDAVESAYKNTVGLNNVHVVQCDIYHLPFRENIFDFIYSIGVLHHLPDPYEGFRSLIKFLKPNSPILIWVYSDKKSDLWRKMRRISLKIPFNILYRLCFVGALSAWGMFIIPYKIANKLGLTKVAQMMKFKEYRKYPFRVLHTDLFDTLSAPIRRYYNYGELKSWFYGSRLDNIRITSTGNNLGWRCYGIKTRI